MSEESVFTLEENEELSSAQRIRKRLLESLTASENGVPVGTADKVLLNSLLDGSDRSVLSRAKLRHDKAASESSQATVKMMAEMLKSINPRTHRPAATPEQRTIPAALEDRTFVPGEMDIGNSPIEIEQLMDKS